MSTLMTTEKNLVQTKQLVSFARILYISF